MNKADQSIYNVQLNSLGIY